MASAQTRIRYGCKAAGWAYLAAVMVGSAQADFDQGMEAYKHHDFQNAISEFRSLAEIGDQRSQYMLGRMYYEARNYIWAYGWIKLAADAGFAQAVEVEKELGATLAPEDRARAQQLVADYSPAGITQRLMPKILPNCEYQGRKGPKLLFASGVYPSAALEHPREGYVTVEVTVAADGRTRDARIISAIPPGVFEDAARRAVRNARYEPATRDGEPISAVATMTVKFQYGTGTSTYGAVDVYVEKLHKMAEGGDPAAQYVYAALINGLPHYQKPWSESLPWIQKAASSGLKEAQFQLGQSLWTGRGCEVDRDKAVDWLKRAAVQGSASAQVSLARIIMHGNDDAGPDKQLFWLQKAAAGDDRNGKKYLAAFLATTPHESLRDPQRALILAKELARADKEDPILVEIRAAAHAALGEFTAAVGDEQTAIRAAKSLNWNVADMQARLTAYQSSAS